MNIIFFFFFNYRTGQGSVIFYNGRLFLQVERRAAHDYLPAEMAIGKFTLKDGALKAYHTFVNPGERRIGYAWIATEHSQKTHRLPIPPNALGEKNYDAIYDRILDILGLRRNQFFNKDDKQRPRVFIRKQDIKMIKSILNQIAGPVDWNQQFDVWEFEYLFYVMKNAVDYDPQHPNNSCSYAEASAIIDQDKVTQSFFVF